MFVRFLGAIGTVTGSMTELYHPDSDSHFLVDCGMLQGEFSADVPNWMEESFPFKPAELDFLILTHAHLDHIGLIPKLIREGFDGEIWCSEATKDLTCLSLKDSMKIMKQPDARAILKKLRFNIPESGFLTKRLYPADGLSLTFLRSAHILGACSVQVSWKEEYDWRSIAFCGDIGINTEHDAPLPLLGTQQTPYIADYMVLESTYGDTQRPPLVRAERLEAFRELARLVVEEKRIIILPVFAIQRAQDVLFDLHHALLNKEFSRKIPLIAHSPMMQRANRIFAKHMCATEFKSRGSSDSHALRYLWMNMKTVELLGVDPFEQKDVLQGLIEKTMLGSSSVELSASGFVNWGAQFERLDNPEIEVSFDVLEKRGGFVVASAGMCENGPVVGYFRKFLSDTRTTVAITGFCAPGTSGATMLRVGSLSKSQRASIADEQVLEFGESTEATIPLSKIRAKIFRMRYYSGHTDQKGIIDWLTDSYARVDTDVDVTTFIVHGNQRGREGLRDELQQRLKRDELAGIESLTTILPSDPDVWYNLGNQAAKCASPGRFLDGGPTWQTPLGKLVPSHAKPNLSLDRAVQLDLIEPLRRAIAQKDENGRSFDLRLYVNRAWKTGSFKVLRWAESEGSEVVETFSSPLDILYRWIDEDAGDHICFLLERIKLSPEDVLKAAETAIDSRQRLASRALIAELHGHTIAPQKISQLLALALLRASTRGAFEDLIRCGIEPNYVGPNGLTLLHLCAIGLVPSSRVKPLLEAGADPSAVSRDEGQTVLHLLAISTGFHALRHWVGPGQKNYDLESRNERACQVARVLLEADHTLSGAYDGRGRHALHYAASIGSKQLAELLTSCCRDALSRFDEDGWRPCDLARSNGHERLARILEPRS